MEASSIPLRPGEQRISERYLMVDTGVSIANFMKSA
jgi:hypothetical protein